MKRMEFVKSGGKHWWRAASPALSCLFAAPLAMAQSAPSATVPAQPPGNIPQDEARRAAEAAARDRAARSAAPEVHLGDASRSGRQGGSLGSFPVETQCYVARQIVVDTALPDQLDWIPRRLARFERRCVGAQGINFILKSLEGDFLRRGLVTTRAGLPQQDLSKGFLHIVVVPGRLTGVKGGTRKQRRMWAIASPMHVGDLVNLRAMEQALEQIRALPGGNAKADLAPGALPGDSLLQLEVKPPRPVTALVALNNLSGSTIGNWMASGQVSANNLLGRNESLTVNVNNRIGDPALPANSTGSGASFSVPSGYWTFGVSASQNHYRQQVVGAVQTFTTSNVLDTIAANVTRVIARTSTSKTDLQVKVQRRWSRSYIDGVEIALQHQDLTDLAFALNDRRNVGATRLETSLSLRQGIGLLGAQVDEASLPASLPSARYSIVNLELALTRPLGKALTWHSAVRGQYSPRALFGPDVISAGGPYTVRGYDGDRALIGPSGFYWRNDLYYALTTHLQPYALLDTGRVWAATPPSATTPIGAGVGLRANLKGFSLDGFAAMPLNDRDTMGQHHVRIGLTLGASV